MTEFKIVCTRCSSHYNFDENHPLCAEIIKDLICPDCYGQPAHPLKDQNEGVKHDHGKEQLDLLSPLWILGVGQVLTFGAKKYAAHNWRKGIARSRLLASALRHIFAYLGGQDHDPETGLLHLHHASCCLMFASELHITRPDTDDRYKIDAQKGVQTES